MKCKERSHNVAKAGQQCVRDQRFDIGALLSTPDEAAVDFGRRFC
jgi:hypothetical protein